MKVVMDEVKKYSTAIYGFNSAAVKSITSAESIQEAYERFQMFVGKAKSNLRQLYKISKKIGKNVLVPKQVWTKMSFLKA